MNLSLFKSWYAAAALLGLVGALAVVLLFESVEQLRWLRLATGFAAAGCMLLALLYVLRKYMHKYGYSPEFRLKVPIAKLERTEQRLNNLRTQILSKQFSRRVDLQREVTRVLKEEGVQRILKVDVIPGPAGGAPFLIEVNKAFLFGRTAKWLHLHVYISVAFAAAVLVHAGGQWGLDLGGVLLALSGWVVVTGLIGIALWTFGPKWLSRRERDLSIEESFVMYQGFQGKLRELRKQLAAEPELDALLGDVVSARDDASDRARSALQVAARYPEERRRLFQDACVLAGQMRRVEREFRALWRIRLTFMAWRAAHIPAAVLLAVALVLHVLVIWKY